MVNTIKLAKSILAEKDKPIASFLFTGPTGVGKTEICRVLASQLDLNLIRLDMSEYMEGHTTSKLIGAPPGYVGYGDTENQLTEKIKRRPHSLLLLDEIEKAHQDVLNVFLQVMDYGILTDSHGNKVDCCHILIVMTSNAGASEMASSTIGFLDSATVSHRVKDSINRFFSPEFRNRLTKIIHFNYLSLPVIERVVEKFIKRLNLLLVDKHIKIVCSKQVLSYLAKKGYDQKMGARPIKRLIDDEIRYQIVDDILFGGLSGGGEAHFRIDAKTQKLVKKIIPQKKGKKKSSPLQIKAKAPGKSTKKNQSKQGLDQSPKDKKTKKELEIEMEEV